MNRTIPRIIPRDQHPISRSSISRNALTVLYRLKDHGHIAHLVGGCVRDLLLGREPKDFDIATDATPGQIKKLFRNCRLVGRRFRLAHVHFKDETVEVATFRSNEADQEEETAEVEQRQEPGRPRPPRHLVSEDGVVLRDNVFGNPMEDALRRDFTVNALAYDIADFTIIDYVDGVADLERGVISTIGDPAVRFTEDPVRMLRAVRFAAQLGFTIGETTWQALTANSENITRATAPRLYDEMLKMFLSGEAEATYQLMRRAGLFAPLFPQFSRWLDQEREGFPHVRLGRDLEWVDRRIAAGAAISPPLLLALMFGEYLEEWRAALRREGFPPQEAVNGAVAGFLGDQAGIVAIPHRVGVAVRTMLALQNRFRKIPGKKAHDVPNRPLFCDALEYLRCRCDVTGEGGKTLAWWERLAREKTVPPTPAEVEPDKESKHPPRRRRRRRRSNAKGKGNSGASG